MKFCLETPSPMPVNSLFPILADTVSGHLLMCHLGSESLLCRREMKGLAAQPVRTWVSGCPC